jgi:hypothetical protein
MKEQAIDALFAPNDASTVFTMARAFEDITLPFDWK